MGPRGITGPKGICKFFFVFLSICNMTPWLLLIVDLSRVLGRDYHIWMFYDCFFISSMFVCLYFFSINHKNCNFLAYDWFKNVLFSTNSLAKLLSDSLLLDSLLLDSLLSDSSISQSHSRMQFKSTNHIQSCNYVCVRARLLLCFCR